MKGSPNRDIKRKGAYNSDIDFIGTGIGQESLRNTENWILRCRLHVPPPRRHPSRSKTRAPPRHDHRLKRHRFFASLSESGIVKCERDGANRFPSLATETNQNLLQWPWTAWRTDVVLCCSDKLRDHPLDLNCVTLSGCSVDTIEYIWKIISQIISTRLFIFPTNNSDSQ